ncbi:AMP-binding protein [Rhodoferax sp. WC2427]|uniref:AMP-binding protein n=1 Tax=Rhodoferax sp. WC2427 TaxID=3234144 RepID=UPI003466DA8F
MHYPWQAHYPPGMPTAIDTTGLPTVVALLEHSFAAHRDSDAYVFMGHALRYGDVDALSRALAAWLQDQPLAQGDCVAIMLPNLLSFPVAMAAVLRAGFVAVNINPLYTPRELQHQLQDSGAKAIVILDRFVPTLDAIVAHTDVATVLVAAGTDLLGLPAGAVLPALAEGGSSFVDALVQGRSLPYLRPVLQPSDPAVLQYTGGTTGVSKGATLLHRTLVANVLASEAWMAPGLQRHARSTPFTIVCALPLYHVFAFVVCSLLGMRAGARNILIPNPRDQTAMIALLKPYKLHMFPAVNTLFGALLQHPDFAQLDFSELCISNGGGSPVQAAVARRWLEVTGCPITEGYGLSETAAAVVCNRTDSEVFTGDIGLPMPGVHVRMLDDAGQDVPPGQPGEIAIRGPQVMAGYWRRPGDTAAAFTADGYFLSGDVGVMDAQGRIRIIDRKKDMVLVSGFKVYPAEIEAVLARHPGVLECAVVGVHDAATGEAVRAFVVRKDPALSEADVLAFCAEQFTAYKRPRSVEFLDVLPKSALGKVLRRELRTI